MSEAYLGDNLIFIISQPRAGSTLLQRVLAGHTEVAASSEPWLMLHPVYGLRDEGVWTEYDADWAHHGLTEFLENYTDGPQVYDDAIRAFAGQVYNNALKCAEARYFIDKTPRYVLIVDDLIRLFPRAKFIFLLRNPLSVLASVVNTQISHDLTTLERFTPELLTGPPAILAGIQQLDDQAIVVRYEDFVSRPEAETQRICAALGIDYQNGMVDYSGTEAVKGFMQDRTGIQQHSRPMEDSKESWRQLLADAQQIHFAQNYLSDLGPELFEQLGYAYEELNDEVAKAAQRTSGAVTLPWATAVTHPEFKKGVDQLYVSLYRNVRDHGGLKGRLLTAGSFIRAFLVQMRWIFGRTRSSNTNQRRRRH